MWPVKPKISTTWPFPEMCQALMYSAGLKEVMPTFDLLLYHSTL